MDRRLQQPLSDTGSLSLTYRGQRQHRSPARPEETIMRILLIGTIFLSAFLLFLVQPIIAKQIIPWFGGTSAVWATCMMFFQVTLLMGYAYSDFVVRRIQPKIQSLFHIGLLFIALLTLPIIPHERWKPFENTEPTLHALALLLFTVGLPYFMLSTTGPLLQAWYTRRFPGSNVYRLFALSNIASLAGLISYPFVIEPYLTTAQQSWGWSAFFALFAVSCATIAWKGRHDAGTMASHETGPSDAEADTVQAAPQAGNYLVWLSLAALGSMMLLSVTNHITQNIASVPFLWLLPLSVYLLTFILCFDGHGWYRQERFAGPVLTILFFMACGLYYATGLHEVMGSVLLYTIGLFLSCMFLHGELANRKPAPRYLTRFYLMVSLGGAIGSIFVSAVAPNIFSSYFELPIALVSTGILLLVLLRRYLITFRTSYRPLALAIANTFFTAYISWMHYEEISENTVLMQRNFYGSLSITSHQDESAKSEVNELLNGTILHGRQFLDKEKRNTPTTYYGESSGIGYVLKKMASRPINAGFIGLGVGTLASYGKAGDYFRFYEINPQAKHVAQNHFWYLRDTPAKVDISLGDARLLLEKELKDGKPGQFDILVVDAFTSDSIPVHLLTREALQVYRQHIKPDGVIAFHTSNRFLDLPPVIKQLVDEAGMQAIKFIDRPENGLAETDWVLVTNNEGILKDPAIQSSLEQISPIAGLKPWTDDYSNLFQILIR
jgi:hypothetical protein